MYKRVGVSRCAESSSGQDAKGKGSDMNLQISQFNTQCGQERNEVERRDVEFPKSVKTYFTTDLNTGTLENLTNGRSSGSIPSLQPR